MKNKGFTLVELLTVIFILGIIGTAGFSLYSAWLSETRIVDGRQIALTALREAKAKATLEVNDSDWGIKNNSNALVLFSSSTYETRDVDQDQIFQLPVGVTVSGIDEIIFSQSSGLPPAEANLIISYEQQQIQINVSAQGVFSY